VDAAISIHDLSKRFPGTLALDDVSFDVPRGSLFGLLGPNGAGKTTLFSIAAGFLKPSGGSLEILGVDVAHVSELRGRFSMLPQDAGFQAGIPVLDQLVMFARLAGYDPAEAARRAREALELVGLGQVAKRSARALSHGMMKRVALCQAFLGEPEVILLDEPTAGLDPENARRMRELIVGMRTKQTLVLSSHNLREVQELCDHAAILHLGRLEICDSMEALTSAHALVRIELAQPLPDAAAAALCALPGVRALERSGERGFNLELDPEAGGGHDAVLRAVQRCLVTDHDLVPRSLNEGASLEARFLEITGGTYDGAGST
jgi:ABC-type multidrug transport system ATPase subunit